MKYEEMGQDGEVLYWSVISALSDQEIWPDNTNNPPTVEVLVNGKPVDTFYFFKMWAERVQDMVYAKAAEIVADKADDFAYEMDKLSWRIKGLVGDFCVEKFGTRPREDD